MTEEQAERLIEAASKIADAVRAVAAGVEDQTVMLGDIHRRLAEIAEAAEGGKAKAPRNRRKTP